MKAGINSLDPRIPELTMLRDRWDELRTQIREDVMKARINGTPEYIELNTLYQEFFDF